jgi:hypothetical protein
MRFVFDCALRRDAVIKRMLATPPKPHSEMKIGKSKAKSGKSQRPKRSGISRALALRFVFLCYDFFAAFCLPRLSGLLGFVFWPIGNDRTDEFVQKV